jgi:exopolysaccharide biosynthesis polyprenyl glycosylphosphotransferase
LSLRISQIVRPFFANAFDSLNIFKPIPTPQEISPYVMITIAIIWVIVLMRLGVYDPEKNYRIVDEVYSLLIGTLSATVMVAGLFYIIDLNLSRLVFIINLIITPFFLTTHRAIYRIGFQKKRRIKRNQNRILIAGAGIVGRQFQKEIENLNKYGYQLVGFIDDNVELVRDDLMILGTLDQTIQIIETHHIDHIVIALPQSAHKRIETLVELVYDLPVLVWIIPDIFSLMLITTKVFNFAGMPMINLHASPLNNSQRFNKRVFDLVIAIPILILTLPLIGLISLLIRLDSEGSVFYRSPRMMENGGLFYMVKFRTMRQNAHEQLSNLISYDKDGNLIHKKKDDPRVTRVGKFLRKTSLDEIPQLINIIKGEMSLVGPRPELPELVQHYKPWQYKRFSVPQGLTGWWQISGRSDKPMHLHTDEDLFYIKHYSIWLDIQILIKTILIVLRGKGAY